MNSNQTPMNAAQRLSASKIRQGFRLEALHEYRDTAGQVLHWRIRLKNPNIGEKWIWPMWLKTTGYVLKEPHYPQGKPLYNLHQVAQQEKEPVFVCEGEWCVDALTRLGVLATTSGSAGSATTADWQLLADHQIIIWPDQDEAGQRFASDAATMLQKLGCSHIQQIDIAKLQLPEKGDVVDWLEQHPGATKEDVMNLPILAVGNVKGAQHVQEKTPNRSQASVLVDFVLPQVKLFHDANSIVYAKNHITGETWRLGSQRFRDWMVANFYKSTGKFPREQSVREALSTLSGLARNAGDCHPVFIRVAEYQGDYYLDLAEEGLNRAIRITVGHWEIVNNPPVYFLRPETMCALPEPDINGDLSLLWRLINIPEEDRILVVTWLLECLRPDMPFPILELIGEQGSAKSTTQAMLRQMVDPNTCNLRAAPKNIEDIFVTAGLNWLVSYENISHLSGQMQDALCVLATGGGFAKRKLYTDADESVINVKRPVVLNGISAAVTAQDLLDRTLSIETPVIKSRTEVTELWHTFEAERAKFLGGLLNIFSQALARLPSIQLPPIGQPRLAEFTRFGMAVSVAMGQTGDQFLTHFKARRQEALARTLDASPVAVALMEWFEEEGKQAIIMPVKILFAKVAQKRPSTTEAWPRSAKGFANALRRVAPALREFGIECQSVGKIGSYVSWEIKSLKN